MRERQKENWERKQEELNELLEDLSTRIEEIREEFVLELEGLEDMIAESL